MTTPTGEDVPDSSTIDIMISHLYTGKANQQIDSIAGCADGFFNIMANSTYLGNDDIFFDLLLPAFHRNWRTIVADKRWHQSQVPVAFIQFAAASVHRAIVSAEHAANQFSISSLKKLLRLMEEEVEREVKQLPSELELLDSILWWSRDSTASIDVASLVNGLIDFGRIDSQELSKYFQAHSIPAIAADVNRDNFPIERRISILISKFCAGDDSDGMAKRRRKHWQLWRTIKQLVSSAK